MKQLIVLLGVLFTITTFAQVGISSDSTFVPTSTLDVDGSTKIRGALTLPNISPSSGYKVLTIDQTSEVDTITLSSTTANNGLTSVSDNIQLGGTLLQNTDIAQAGFNFRFTGSGNVGIGMTTVPSHKFHVAGGVRSEGGFVVNDGTAATPAYRFNSQGNIGMYRVTTDVLGFATVGVERMRITSTGTVQISNLAGTGNRTVYADANGVLNTTEAQVAYFTTGSQVYATAGTNSFIVPAGITKIRVFLLGAGGGGVYGSASYYGGYGGAGGHVDGELVVTPGETLTVVVGTGGAGRSGNTAGGGGTATTISRSTTLLAAAGGGAGGSVAGTREGYSGQGGGMTLGTSTAGAAGSTTYNISSTGGNNYTGYLQRPISTAGSGYFTNYNTAVDVTGSGYFTPSIFAMQNTLGNFQNSALRVSGRGGNRSSTTAANNNGMAGLAVLVW